MKNELDIQLNSYYNEISSSVNCSKEEKKRFLGEIKKDIEDFMFSNPQSDMEQIISVFGTPVEIAESFEPGRIKADNKKSILKMILAAVIIALFFYLAFIVISLIDVHTEAHGYFSEGVLQIYGFIKEISI